MNEFNETPRYEVKKVKVRNDQLFDLWCVVELFGHQKIAGRCTEQNVAGVNMLRVDVPAMGGCQEFTRFLSAGAIYAINPVTEEIAREIAGSLNIQPVSVWDIRSLVDEKLKALKAGDGYLPESDEL
ncbi:MAG: hypothetical protein LBC19_13695 [Tannerella sp.]|jgi:hypothetical protein|nr:hypothetical protein [Tannerella sp.]